MSLESSKGVDWKILLVVGAAAAAGLFTVYYTSKKPAKKKSILKSESIDFVASSEQNENLNEEKEVNEETNFQVEDVSSLSDQKRDELALAAKNRGNKYYSAKKYEKAAELYTKAIELYKQPTKGCAVFYSNRAACFANIGDYDKVIQDCTRALEMDSKYLKAILRRAAAFEKLSNRVEALQDYTTACLIEEFKMESTIQSADRVLRSLATEKVKERMEDLKNNESLPSPSFISAYLGSFRFDYCERLTSLALDNSSQGDLKMANVRDALKKKDWDSAYAFCKEALEAGLLNADIHALALNLYGTFNFLMGRTENAITAYKKSLELDSTNTNTLIKLGSVMMEKVEEKGLENALQWFEKALSVGGGDRDPDVYYHRGQIYFLVQEYEKALLDYEKSISMDGNFLFALIQKAVVLYRLGRVEESEAEFEKIHKQFPASADPHYYYGEIMLDRQKIEESMREFDEAISLDPSLPLPHLNKGIISFHLKNDFDQAIKETQLALKVDPRCDLAYMHLAQMYVQKGKFNEALDVYGKALELAKSPVDLENVTMGMEAAKAQMVALERLNAERSK